MWQKARIIDAEIVPTQVRGRIVWVVAVPPIATVTEDSDGGLEFGYVLFTNVEKRLKAGNALFALDYDVLELLPEFVEDVPLISEDEFWAQRRG